VDELMERTMRLISWIEVEEIRRVDEVFKVR